MDKGELTMGYCSECGNPVSTDFDDGYYCCLYCGNRGYIGEELPNFFDENYDY